jgi:F1F0 ATPase subunit 2
MGETVLASLVFAWLLGGALGAFFFGGLWWTVRHTLGNGVMARRPGLWLLASWLVRMGVVLLGFYLTSDGGPAALAVCLLGFLMARFSVLRVTRPNPTVLPP